MNYNKKNNITKQEASRVYVLFYSFFLIPFMIAVFGAIFFLLFKFITFETDDASELLNQVKIGSASKRWQSAIGLTQTQSLKLIILPQALRVAIPPTINQYLNLTKNSSLATAIGYPELMSAFGGTVLNQVGQAVEILGMAMLVYLFISLCISLLLNVVNKRMAIPER